ncbi:hypothetical protein DCCM_4169 [Desulfocucumis palustris]|uniref:RsgI N-terminal anti-sigma domain-containing protein n=1 Tax=Desulfocucumis palustris TaxID=1898651 RepID=A0A2L2XFN0_9FIRM|nr:anti-sigma factor domain-containing protein [Desulfocucumis palustris]GBF35048.1 hypothetical protein DCCM_4169 [Desulfocucumis palustris]
MNNKIVSGVVVELKTASCIVMTPEGGFEEVRLPVNQVRLGDEISSRAVPARGARFGIIRILAAAAALLVIFLTGYSLTDGLQPQAAAYVSLDINPSIELGIDGQSRIIDARGLNEDGKKLLLNMHLKKLPLSQGLSNIVEEAIHLGYIKEGQENLILSTLVYSNEKTVAEKAELKQVVKPQSVEEAIEKPLTANSMESRVVVEEVRPELREKAVKAGVSSGKMLFKERAGDNHVKVEIEELKRENLQQLEKSKNIRLEKLFPGEGKKKLQIGDRGNKSSGAIQSFPARPAVKTQGLRGRDNELKRAGGEKGRSSDIEKGATGKSTGRDDYKRAKSGGVPVFPDQSKQNKSGNGKESGAFPKKQPDKKDARGETVKKGQRENEKSGIRDIWKSYLWSKGD